MTSHTEDDSQHDSATAYIKLLDTIQSACTDGSFLKEQKAASSSEKTLNLFDSGREEACVLIAPLNIATGPGCSESTEVHLI